MAEMVMQKTKLVFKDAGDVKTALAALTDDNPSMVLGDLFGVAESTVTRSMPTGDVFEGVCGSFEIARRAPLTVKGKDGAADSTVSILASRVLFMPSNVHDAFVPALKTGAVEFSAHIVMRRDASAKGGYSLAMEYVHGPVGADPLALARQRHAAALATPADEKPAKGGKA